MATVNNVSKASLRGLRFNARMEKMREAAAKLAPRTVNVMPANDDMRRLLKHPHAGGFPKDGGGGAVWPDDRFTKRRIADGDITTEEHGEDQHSQQHDSRRRPHRSERTE
jgi:hypothetical protein